MSWCIIVYCYGIGQDTGIRGTKPGNIWRYSEGTKNRDRLDTEHNEQQTRIYGTHHKEGTRNERNGTQERNTRNKKHRKIGRNHFHVMGTWTGVVQCGHTPLERGTCHGVSLYITTVSGRIPVSEVEVPRKNKERTRNERNRTQELNTRNKEHKMIGKHYFKGTIIHGNNIDVRGRITCHSI